MNKILFLFTFIFILLLLGCNSSNETEEHTQNPTFKPPPSSPVLSPSPTPTTNPNIGYILHVGTNSDTCNTEIAWSGDYNGVQIAPFDIGPVDEPFTVEVAIKDHECKSTDYLSYLGYDWELDGQTIRNPNLYFNSDYVVTIEVDDEHPNRTLLFHHMFLANHPALWPSGTENMEH